MPQRKRTSSERETGQSSDPLLREFVRYSEYLSRHPIPEPMMWMLLRIMREAAEFAAATEKMKQQEYEIRQSSGD